jgi:hypothetical protein
MVLAVSSAFVRVWVTQVEDTDQSKLFKKEFKHPRKPQFGIPDATVSRW